jgi:hypothetical protein
MTLQQLINKAMTDATFFEELKKNPAVALRTEGGNPTQQQIDALKKVNYDALVGVATAFGGGTGIT